MLEKYGDGHCVSTGLGGRLGETEGKEDLTQAMSDIHAGLPEERLRTRGWK